MLPDSNLKPPFICPCIHVLVQTHRHTHARAHAHTNNYIIYTHVCGKGRAKRTFSEASLGKESLIWTSWSGKQQRSLSKDGRLSSVECMLSVLQAVVSIPSPQEKKVYIANLCKKAGPCSSWSVSTKFVHSCRSGVHGHIVLESSLFFCDNLCVLPCQYEGQLLFSEHSLRVGTVGDFPSITEYSLGRTHCCPTKLRETGAGNSCAVSEHLDKPALCVSHHSSLGSTGAGTMLLMDPSTPAPALLYVFSFSSLILTVCSAGP